MKEEHNENQTSRQMEGALKVYKSRQMAEEAIHSAQPITTVSDHKKLLHGEGGNRCSPLCSVLKSLFNGINIHPTEIGPICIKIRYF